MKDEIKTFSIRVDKEYARKIKLFLVNNDISFQKMVIELLEQYIPKDK